MLTDITNPDTLGRAYIIIPKLVRRGSWAALQESGFKKSRLGERIHRFSENGSSIHGNKNAFSKNIDPFGAQKINNITTLQRDKQQQQPQR